MYLRIKNNKVKAATLQKLVGVVLVLSVLGLFTSNPALTIAGLWMVPILLYFLWQPGEPPSFLMIVLYQWLQVFTPVLNANIQGIGLGDNINLPQQEMATYLGYLTIIFLTIGIRYGSGIRLKTYSHDYFNFSSNLDSRRLLLLYLITFVFSLFIDFVMWAEPSLTQLIGSLRIYRWAVVFLIIWLAVVRRDIRNLAAVIVLIEIIVGFFGFFSAFKTIFLVLLVAVVAHEKVRFPGFNIKYIGLSTLLLACALIWQTIKIDYRDFQRQGEATQISQVSIAEKAQYLVDALGELPLTVVISSFDSLILRLGYTEFFGYTITVVPQVIPFQDGRLWGEAILHIFTPRMFFPDKPALDDSSRTREFTGIPVANAEEGASIGLGYAAESYIDFGPYFMFFPILLLGYLFGLGYRFFITIRLPKLIGFSIANAYVITSGFLFETSNIKIFGGIITIIIVNILLLKSFVFFRAGNLKNNF